ncbi:MAG: CBS domain-containing protein [Deltaproteobacteria bacterium]|nr:CBS domain-containing protein [Deltaproteobacteria bacterium]MBW2064820.1 CBS domain-containing protein [Deltaproteobacteria bacterium]
MPRIEAAKVAEILAPFRQQTPLQPSASLDDSLVHAVELMLKHNLRCLAVVKRGRPLGLVYLKEALDKLGIQNPSKITTGNGIPRR